MADTSSPAVAEKTIVDEIKANTPKCWRTLYHLLDLYSTMPETKTVVRRASASRLSVIDEEPEKASQTHSLSRQVHGSTLRVGTKAALETMESIERQAKMTQANQGTTTVPPITLPRAAYTGNTFTQSKFMQL